MARRLAALGFRSLRFDPSGVGDADDPNTSAPAHAYSEVRLEDVREALRWLEREGAQRFVLIGLCSAAYVAFQLARSDARIAAEVLINPQTFTWREGDTLELAVKNAYGSNRHYRTKLRDPETWKRALRGELHLAGITKTVATRVLKQATWRVRGYLPQLPGAPLHVLAALRKTLRQGTHVTMVYSLGDAGLDYIEGHIGKRGAALRKQPRFQLHVVDGVDHTFSQRPAQQWLCETIAQQLTRQFSVPARDAAASGRAFAAAAET
jgi:hypothetical protein